jgi:magnesium-transporting ATPase (P-type)
LRIDEAALTGESVPTDKSVMPIEESAGTRRLLVLLGNGLECPHSNRA